MNQYINEIREEYQKGLDYIKNSNLIKSDDLEEVKVAIIKKLANDYALDYYQVEKMVK